MTSKKVKRGPRRRRRKPRIHVIQSWSYCERCGVHTRTFPNKMTALHVLPDLWDSALMCINRFGGVHLAVTTA